MLRRIVQILITKIKSAAIPASINTLLQEMMTLIITTVWIPGHRRNTVLGRCDGKWHLSKVPTSSENKQTNKQTAGMERQIHDWWR